MAWLRRQDTSEPQIDYLSTPDSATRPMALVSILFTFVIIAALIFLLLTVGRWGYEQLVLDRPADAPATTSQTEETPPTTVTNENSAAPTSPVVNDDPTTPTQITPPATQSSQSGVNTSSSGTSSSTPATGPSAVSTVPATGPSHVFGLFLGSFIFAMCGYYVWQLRQFA